MTRNYITAVVGVLAVVVVGMTWSVLRGNPAGAGIAVNDNAAGSRERFRPSAETTPPSSGAGAAASQQALTATNGSAAGADAGGAASAADTAKMPAPELVIQVVGAVKHPGVYHLNTTARNDDAVRAAGGLAADANAASVNLAAHAVDGAQLYIKSKKEQPVGGVADDGTATAASAPLKPDGHSSFVASAARRKRGGSSRGGSGGRSAKLKDPSEGTVNINTATAEELQKISGIGPSMAEKIIAYRQENHGFQSPEDLMQVSGIGAKKFAKFAPFVRVR